ncbi:uncharacterized protein EDB91DRAFT_1086157 [Suillus paluster]|uniref:uncharacterized protein n=1 Tax=Suillus paluster TaxID=48578 RepID=UPI001B8679F3|nr:uncharacterized protein EDB91DRAFT_1086157 [Suillus paluster]KAG1728281.1 hypothetical protein EDB91DRAFT_1086157 [Suillus paluster]
MHCVCDVDGYQDYVTNGTINGLVAQQQKGAAIIVEHRFFGKYNPYDNLTSQCLALLTIQQAIDDLVYFATTADLLIPGGDAVKPGQAPWTLVGGSYSGALTSWTMVDDYYGYFSPIRKYMPRNCSSDVEAVIAYLVWMYAVNDTAGIQSLKEAFGLGGVAHVDHFASARESSLPLVRSSSLRETDTLAHTPYSCNFNPTCLIGKIQYLVLAQEQVLFFQFCDALEVKNGVNAGPEGWRLENAIFSWACDDQGAECTQLGFYKVGPPGGQPAIRQCVNRFPQVFASPREPTTVETNKIYAGWDVDIPRLFFADGLRDTWREATVSAYGLNKANATSMPIYESDGFRCTDMIPKSGIDPLQWKDAPAPLILWVEAGVQNERTTKQWDVCQGKQAGRKKVGEKLHVIHWHKKLRSRPYNHTSALLFIAGPYVHAVIGMRIPNADHQTGHDDIWRGISEEKYQIRHRYLCVSALELISLEAWEIIPEGWPIISP